MDVTLGHTIKINDHELVALIGRDDIEKQNIDFQLRLTRFYRSVKAYSMQAPVICYARSVENLSGLREAYKYCCQLEYTEITEDKPFTCIPDLNKATDSPVQGSVKTEVLQILHYIDEHIDDKLSLEDLSELVHLNREYLCRLFKKETGKSLFGYIAELRMQKAAKMIMDGHTSVQDVAQSIGFQNPYVFSKRFKEYYGVSPLKYDGRPPVSEAVRDEETE
ncbi:MAG: AraC family transcriptional regulator [Eubacteriales bacterium]|nr:AraC family transcriptional regulator [Eubacteriales bacterium]